MRLYHLFAASIIGAMMCGSADAQVRQPPAAAPAAPSQPERVETTNYDAWQVICREAGGKKNCGAVSRIVTQGSREPLIIWEIGSNEQGRPITIIRAPVGLAIRKDNQTIGGGIMIQNGIELKFGNGQARRLSFVSCNPQRCIAEAGIDDAFVKEATANTTATITAYALGGQAVPFEISIKGIDKAITLTRK